MNKSKEVLYKTITMMLTINGGREGEFRSKVEFEEV